MADDKKKKKENKHWFKDFKTELKKVTWQTPKQLIKNTAAVIVLVLIVALIVFVCDIVFENINKQGVEKLKAIIQSNETVQNVTIENTTEGSSIVDSAINEAIEETVDTINENTSSEDETTSQENSNVEE